MKKIISLLLALAMTLALTACGGDTDTGSAQTTGANGQSQTTGANGQSQTTVANGQSQNTGANGQSQNTGGDYKYTGGRLTIGGADSTGTMYAAAVAIATTFTNNINGMDVDATTSTGSNENAKKVHSGDLQLGMCSGDAALDAVNGTGKFTGEGGYSDLRAIGAVYPSLSNWVALKSSGYKYLHDAKDAKGTFGIGPAASTSESSALLGLKIAGITKDNANLVNVTLGEGADNVANGTMTASTAFAGVPVGAHQNAAATKDCVWLGFTDEELDAICKENPAYYKTVIPKETYKGQTEDVSTFGVKCMVICNEKMGYDEAYQMAKTLYEQAETMIRGNGFFYNMAEKSFIAIDLPIQLHPGAEAFYREVGIIK